MPATWDSVDDILGDVLPGSKSKTFVVAQNQVTLVQDNSDKTIIEQIDTEPHLTIGQIRAHLCRQLNANHVDLKHNDRLLDNDNNTLADYGWVPGECGTITVHAVNQPYTTYTV